MYDECDCGEMAFEMSSFHLPIGEVTMTLEDVWCILQILIHGELIVYNLVSR